jgi:DNA-binding PadR family transcriptional regulator
VWPLNVGQVYTTLQRLERDGLVISEGDGDSQQLSPGGATARTSRGALDREASVSSAQLSPGGATPRTPRGALDREASVSSAQKAYRITSGGMRELRAWLRTPPDLSSPPRDELVMKILIALRVPGASVADVIQVHRRYLVELMQQWTRIKEDSDPADLSLGLAVDAELFRLDAVVRWLDAADGRIKRAAADAKALAPGDSGSAAGHGAPAITAAVSPGVLGPLPTMPQNANRKARTRR